MRIEPYVHQCIIPDGDMAGNTYSHEVSEWDIENQSECPYCDNPMATTREIVAHIYWELTK